VEILAAFDKHALPINEPIGFSMPKCVKIFKSSCALNSKSNKVGMDGQFHECYKVFLETLFDLNLVVYGILIIGIAQSTN
jgi:hypothetical protein